MLDGLPYAMHLWHETTAGAALRRLEARHHVQYMPVRRHLSAREAPTEVYDMEVLGLAVHTLRDEPFDVIVGVGSAAGWTAELIRRVNAKAPVLFLVDNTNFRTLPNARFIEGLTAAGLEADLAGARPPPVRVVRAAPYAHAAHFHPDERRRLRTGREASVVVLGCLGAGECSLGCNGTALAALQALRTAGIGHANSSREVVFVEASQEIFTMKHGDPLLSKATSATWRGCRGAGFRALSLLDTATRSRVLCSGEAVVVPSHTMLLRHLPMVFEAAACGTPLLVLPPYSRLQREVELLVASGAPGTHLEYAEGMEEELEDLMLQAASPRRGAASSPPRGEGRGIRERLGLVTVGFYVL